MERKIKEFTEAISDSPNEIKLPTSINSLPLSEWK